MLTVGTFLDGKIILVWTTTAVAALRPPVTPLSRRLRELPLRVSRLKTGTPPRIDARTIDFSVLGQQTAITRCRSSHFWAMHLNIRARCRVTSRIPMKNP
ncbi:FAD-dependent oxidoreductase [Shigella flexneri]